MMRDDLVCRVEGTGTTKMKMHDNVVRTLNMLRYIPKLKKNLISLGTFDKNDYSYKAKRGKLIIAKGSLVVMNGEIQPNCLYHLCGTTMTASHARVAHKEASAGSKSKVFTKFKEWKSKVENLTGRKIKILRSDNEGEYKDSKFMQGQECQEAFYHEEDATERWSRGEDE
ncbi:unnamed protein product [Prunus brigantina]